MALTTLLDQAFSFFPGRVLRAEGHTRSDSTRAPQEFDKHLSDDMVLKRVVVVPGMAQDLMTIAEQALESRGDLPAVPRDIRLKRVDFTRERNLITFFENVRDKVTDEAAIQHYYQQTTGQLCAMFAATLELGDKVEAWDTSSLEWRINTGDRSDANSKERGMPIISSTPQSANPDGYLLSTQKGEERHELLARIREVFPSLVVAEFKNLNFEGREHFENILLASELDPFGWTACTSGAKCVLEHGDHARWCRMGPDADRSTLASVQRMKEHPDVAQKDLDTHANGKKSKDARPKVTKKTQRILQQVWAELCENDATYAFINAGNGEIIAERHRESQTIYLSDFVDVPNVEYLKLHTGLYIAAIRDADVRAKLLALDPPSTWSRHLTTVVDLRSVAIEELPGRIFDLVTQRRWLALRTDCKNAPALFIREELYQRHPSLLQTSNPVSNSSFFSIITKLPQRNPHNYRGRLSFNDVSLPVNSESAASVFVKTAHGDTDTLKREYELYGRLLSQGLSGIARIYGYYEHVSDKLGKFGALVFESLGHSVEDWLAANSAIRTIPISQKQRFREIIMNLLKAGVNLPTLSKKHLMVVRSDDKYPTKVAVVGLECAEVLDKDDPDSNWILPNCARKMIETLNTLLPNPLHHAREPEAEESLEGDLSQIDNQQMPRFNGLETGDRHVEKRRKMEERPARTLKGQKPRKASIV